MVKCDILNQSQYDILFILFKTLFIWFFFQKAVLYDVSCTKKTKQSETVWYEFMFHLYISKIYIGFESL